jgi:LmbE family N-acetylglucosaminyl deacetylase
MEERKSVLLAVLAHPDDESFGLGGTLALYAARGVETHLVCATRGEAGTVDAKHLEGYESIADRRVDELRCAAGILGLSGVHFLDYRDSGMSGSPDNQHPQALAVAPLDEVAGKIVDAIRRLRPQVVLTFDPIGGYKHPDHIAIHQATLRAFYLAGEAGYVTGDPPYQPQKLYYQVIPKGFLRVAVRLLPLFGRDPRRFGRNADIDVLALVEEGNFPVHAVIDYGPVFERKQEASACHASQADGAALRRGPLRWLQYLAGRKEYYMRAYPPALDGLKEKDLFEGIASCEGE